MSRFDDVDEQHGRQNTIGRRRTAVAGEKRLDLVEHAVGVASEPDVVIAVELDEPSVRNPLGEICDVVMTDVAVAASTQQQRWRLNAAHQRADVDAHPDIEHGREIPWATAQPLTARPPPALSGITAPTWRQLVDKCTATHEVAGSFDVAVEQWLGHSDWMVGGAGVARIRTPQHE